MANLNYYHEFDTNYQTNKTEIKICFEEDVHYSFEVKVILNNKCSAMSIKGKCLDSHE